MSDTADETLRFRKSELRKTIRGHLNEFTRSRSSLAECSAQAQKQFLSLDVYAACGTVLAFVSIASEPDSAPLIIQALGDGKVVAVPRVMGPDMRFFRINPEVSLDSQLFPGVFGIREPDESAEPALLSGLQGDVLVMVPGLAFSADGKRLGKGGGYYDRFLAELRAEFSKVGTSRVTAAGYCFDFQIRQDIPVGDMDMPVDYVITDKRIMRAVRKV